MLFTHESLQMYLYNVQHSSLANMNLWNNRFHMDLEQTHEACKFVINIPFLFNKISNMN
jgi:hypothetical protein